MPLAAMAESCANLLANTNHVWTPRLMQAFFTDFGV
jgi:hypothetical protein